MGRSSKEKEKVLCICLQQKREGWQKVSPPGHAHVHRRYLFFPSLDLLAHESFLKSFIAFTNKRADFLFVFMKRCDPGGKQSIVLTFTYIYTHIHTYTQTIPDLSHHQQQLQEEQRLQQQMQQQMQQQQQEGKKKRWWWG